MYRGVNSARRSIVSRSVEIVALRVLRSHRGVQSGKPLGAEIDDPVLNLQHAANEKQRRARDEQRISLEALRRHDDIDRPGLVLERQEDEPLGRPRALTTDDETGGGDRLAVLAARHDI